jgi:radical SAM protein with 4Fe4S-binding SPASM domain
LIAPDGEIYPCTALPPPISLGNLRDITVREAWEGDLRREFLKEHLRLGRYTHPPCVGCFVPVNTVVSREDIIDAYRDAILKRLNGVS